MDDLLSEFLTETSENLAVLDVELVQLEQNPNDPDLLGNIFRLFHTIKGTCGFLGLPRLETVAHAAENVLGKFRDGELPVTPAAVTLILESLDTIKDLLATLEETEQEPEGTDEGLIARLNAMAEGKVEGRGGRIDGAPEAAAETSVPEAAAPEPPEPETPNPATPNPAMPDPAMPDPEMPDEAESGGSDSDDLQALFDAARAEMLEAAEQPKAAPAETTAKPSAPSRRRATRGGGEAKDSSIANQSIRVNVELLENLMTTVSELVLTRNQLLQLMRQQKESDFTGPLQRLNHVVSELQEGVMKTRMQPIGNAWAKLPRIVRDLSQELGKKINLEMAGAETELDRQVLELIKDPLTHMVRNSGDHGIETVAERHAAGKSETGTIKLHAFHQGGHIVIEISDDGKGLNIERIKTKVVENGLATEDELASMTDQQIQQFIFKAGFSTASAVTAVSGRGVGMDVVRTNIERIGGTVELTSQEGKGSTFLIKIPLTLAIVSALIVECAGERFAIPQISVVELVRAGGSQSDHSVERLNGTPVLRLRERLLPLVSLRDQLELDGKPLCEPAAGDAQEADAREGEAREGEAREGEAREAETGAEEASPATEDAFIIVTQVGTYTFGIIVDRVFDTEEIVVKPVSPVLRHIGLFSGNTILGDGSVIMILDPNGVAAATGEISVGDEASDGTTPAIGTSRCDKTALLVFRAGGGAPKAVPLALVSRLEDIEVGKMEASNATIVVQYRGHLMPLVPYDSGFSLEQAREEMAREEMAGERGRKSRPVLVFADGERQMGLIVDEIVDIVEQVLNVDIAAADEGLLGSAIIEGQATDVIDAGHFLTLGFGDWFGAGPEDHHARLDDRHVLVVDDSPFFRNMITPMLAIGGLDVTTVSSAEEAMNLRDRGEMFDAIISDIEMPDTDGFAFAEKIRAGGPWSSLPIIALSSHASPHHIQRGRDVGFTDYVAKSDRGAIIAAINETLAGTGAAA